MSKSRIFLGIITSEGNAEHLQWIRDVIPHIDGLAAVYHGKPDQGSDVLFDCKKEGFVVMREFYNNHFHSMNDFLLNNLIIPGRDWIVLRDTLERLTPEFAANLRELISNLKQQAIHTVYQYSKCFMFQKEEHQLFLHTPHWGLYNPRKNFLAIESVTGFQDPKTYAYSVRNDVRPVDHFIDHFVKYYLMDSSNHLQLGRENRPEDFRLHESIRIEFKKMLREKNVPLTVAGLLRFFELGPDPETKTYINFEPILNHFYRYRVLKHPFEEVRKDRDANKMVII